MLFNSYLFILIFFPLCITGFYLLNKLTRDVYAKLWLIGFSLWFYGYFNVYYLAIMVFSIGLNYALMHAINCFDENKKRRIPLVAGIVLNLGVLFYFKYFDFFLSTINEVFKTSIPMRNILLPLGISFFTFQQIGFLVDIYRKETDTVNFVDYALFVSFFPQLIAGPIVSQAEMLPQFKTIRGRKLETEGFARGLTLFVLGLSKKVLVADVFGNAVDAGYASLAQMGGLNSFLIMIWYTLQLYFDFSGYCDMARGLAWMLGFELPVNFDSPYKARNIVEFWKQWHMTLTRFFTKYVYIPLGGNRKGKARMLVNILIIYFLSGIWHGAGYNYIFWGMLHGVLYVITRMLMLGNAKKGPTKEKTGALCKASDAPKTVLTFLYVSMAWVFFRAQSISQGFELLGNIFKGPYLSVDRSLSNEFKLEEIWYVIKIFKLDRFAFSQNLPMLLITLAGLGIVFFAPNAAKVSKDFEPSAKQAILIGLIGMWCIMALSQVSTFLYFNF